jgi:hypothetical protein
MQGIEQRPTVVLPVGTSDLTRHPLEDFEATHEWVELGQIPVKSDADGFWHCMRQWKHERHWIERFGKLLWSSKLSPKRTGRGFQNQTVAEWQLAQG